MFPPDSSSLYVCLRVKDGEGGDCGDGDVGRREKEEKENIYKQASEMTEGLREVAIKRVRA